MIAIVDRRARRRLALACLLGAASVVAAVGLLATSGWLISRAAEHPSIAALGVAVVGVRFFAVSRGLFRYGERLVGHDAALGSLAALRVRVYERLERLAPAGLPGFRRGDLLARLVADVDVLQDLVLRVVPAVAIATIVGVATVGFIAWVLPAAGAVLAVSLLLAATVVPWLTQWLAGRSEARQAEVRGDLTAAVVDLVDGAPDLIAFGASATQLDRIGRADDELSEAAAAAAGTAGIGSALTVLLTGLAVWGSLLVGVPAVAGGRLPGVALAVVVLTPLAAFEAVAGLPAAAQALERVRRSAERVGRVLDASPPVEDPAAPASVPPGRPALSVRGLRAAYLPAGPLVLDGVDLELVPGRRIGVVGPSGAGKSTLANVLLRFLQYSSGSVRLNGVELDRLAGGDVRRVVGLIEQDTHLFDTTIRENLLLADRDTSEARLRDVLGRVGLLGWVDRLPEGLDTPVGVHGTAVSGGQRQRLALARALIADFAILVLDEPGEHLDPATADALTADMQRAAGSGDRAVLLITHRLAGLDAVDEVVVLVGGRVVERGTHDALVQAGGRYAELWHLEQRARQTEGATL